jgi:hypothetical protein
MAFHWWDSFDGYPTADLGLVYDQSVGSMTIGAFGRNGTNGLQWVSSGANYVVKAIAGAPATVGLSCGIRSNVNTAYNVFGHFVDGTTVQIELRINNQGKIEVLRGQNGMILATGTKIINSNTYVHVEAKVLIHPSAGTAVVKINGVIDINASGLNTRATGTSQATNAYLGCTYNTGNGATGSMDDVIVWDTTGAAPQNDFPGDLRAQNLIPTGDGAATAWTINGGSTHFDRVDESAQDGDTTYSSDATPGDRELFTFSDLSPSAGTILGVAYVNVVRKDDAGARSIVSVHRQGGVNYDNATVHALGTTYTYERDQLTLNPATGVAYTVAEINALEAGLKVNA